LRRATFTARLRARSASTTNAAQRRLAAARRAEQHDELSGADFEVDAAQRAGGEDGERGWHPALSNAASCPG